MENEEPIVLQAINIQQNQLSLEPQAHVSRNNQGISESAAVPGYTIKADD